tara:strand:+ start:388 stop:681 length:294 start_codon:yes stop_codon:yes gene_type:complete
MSFQYFELKVKIMLFFLFTPSVCLPNKFFLNNIIPEQYEKKNIKNKKSFSSGSMGIGLVQSYEINDRKICIYNTVKEQVKKSLNLELTSECPDNLNN